MFWRKKMGPAELESLSPELRAEIEQIVRWEVQRELKRTQPRWGSRREPITQGLNNAGVNN